MSEINYDSACQRQAGIEWLRFLAAFGIVWFHTAGARWREVGYSGLPVFLIVFTALIVSHYSEIPFGVFFSRRFVRLLVPWLFWSLVYIGAKLFKKLVVCPENLGPLELPWLLVGGSLHLWYLPFAFMASIVLYYICRYSLNNQIKPLFIVITLIFSILTLCLSTYIMYSFSFGPPFMQWLFAVPSLPIGFCLGIIIRGIPKHKRTIWFTCVYLTVLMTCSYLFMKYGKMLIIPYVIGLLLTILSLSIKFPFEAVGIAAGKLTYGIYLIHPMVAVLIGIVIDIHIPSILIITTFLVSAAIVFFIKKTVFRWVV